MLNFLRAIWNSHIVARIRGVLVTAWHILCGVTAEANFQTKRFINTCLIILLVNTGLFIIGFAFNWSGPIILAAFSSSIAVLICWKASELAVKIISSLGGEIPVVGSAVKLTAEELKKFLPPLLVASLMLAFVAGIVAIRGVGYYTYTDLLIWSTIVLFTAIFNIYIDAKVKIVGWAMIGFLYYILIGNYMWPIQVQGTLDWIDRYTIRIAIVNTDGTKEDELVVIVNNTPLYNFGFGKFKKEKTTAQTETIAKVISRKNDPKSKEPMYQVVLPVAKDSYVGGEILYVPARLTKLVQREAAPTAATPAAYNVPGKTLAITLQPNEIYKVDELKEGQSWRYLSFSGAFSHRVDKGDGKTCWKVVENNLPWSAGWNGKLEVKGGNTPSQLTVNIL